MSTKNTAKDSKVGKATPSTKRKSKPRIGETSDSVEVQVKKGRPSSFTQEAADIICDRLATGESLRAICREKDMPELSVVIRWLGHPERAAFRLQYAHARTLQAHLIEDELLGIVDDTSGDTIVGEHGASANSEWISRSRLRYDARRWLLSKMLPKKYGDTLDLTTAGESLAKVRVIRPADPHGK